MKVGWFSFEVEPQHLLPLLDASSEDAPAPRSIPGCQRLLVPGRSSSDFHASTVLPAGIVATARRVASGERFRSAASSASIRADKRRLPSVRSTGRV